MMEQSGPGPTDNDRALMLLLGVGIAAVGVVWAWGGAASVLSGAAWPSIGSARLARTLVALPAHLADPRLAWPAMVGDRLPGPVGMYAVLALVLAVVAVATAGGIRLGRAVRPTDDRGDGGRGARWAGGADLRSLRTPIRSRLRTDPDRANPGTRLALGYQGRHLLRAEQRHALVLFGPPQSGKSAGLAIGSLLEWDGPVIASSIKADLLDATIARRRQLGETFVFDPFGLSDEPGSTWAPEHAADSFDAALEVAHRLASAGELDQRSVEGGDFWTVAAEQRLAPLLYLANRSGKGAGALVRWAYGHGEHELDATLAQLTRDATTEQQRQDAHAAFDAVAAFRAQPDRTRGSIEGTTQALLRAYRYTRVQRSAAGCQITPERVLTGASTLYVVGDAKASRLLRPIFLALLGQLIDHAYQLAGRHGGRLPTPLLLCLDELGNVAPLPNLAEIASTAPSHNIQLVSVFHDLAQARSRYGRQAETVINSHRARMLLPGVADLDTLRYFSALIGDQDAREQTTTTGLGYQTTTENPSRRPLAPPEKLRRLRDGSGLLVYGRLPPTTVKLRMWFQDKALRKLSQP